MEDHSPDIDEVLIEQIQLGNKSAFEELYNRYSKVLFLYIYKKLDNQEEAQDVVQEIFTRIWIDRESLHIHTSTSGYLFRQALNRSLNIFRNQKVSDSYIDSLANNVNYYAESADEMTLKNEFQEVINKEISYLPNRMRSVFELRYKDGLTNKEVAELLKISEHTVSTQMKRALKLLRGKLGVVIFAFLLQNI